MLRLRAIPVGRLGHFCSVGQRTYRRTTLTAEWRVVLAVFDRAISPEASAIPVAMERMGHSTTRAALTYLHASDERQRAIAEAMSEISAGELGRRRPVPSGTQHARGRRFRYWAVNGRSKSRAARYRIPSAEAVMFSLPGDSSISR